MGAWGIRALESDEGLEVLHELAALAGDRENVGLDELMAHLEAKGLIGPDAQEDEYLWDNTAIAVGELVLAGADSAPQADAPPRARVEPTEGALQSLVDYVETIHEAEPQDREIKELWTDEERWDAHVVELLDRLSALLP
jgi:hypothetical protein